ncbi:MAG: elongation factor P 5-aminopentanone reductase [Clostridia bacterium]|jgi:short chain dehydrogenase|nr:3-oxoacyl-ACP reductase FabG [Clostridia bacterium]
MNKVILITGASRGIGNNIAKNLAKENIVIANYNNSEAEAKKLKKELEEKNINIDIIKADVCNRNQVKEMIKQTIDKYGHIDVLINNAGISQYKLFTDITDSDWAEIMNTNLNSNFIVTQEVVKNMIHNKEGLIVNISSIWGITGAAMEVAYSTSKAGIIGLTKSLAKELGPSNIRVNAIAPGIINTSMNSKFSEEEINNIQEEIPLEKIGEPEEITKCIEWLIKDNYTTGQVISINGGWNI